MELDAKTRLRRFCYLGSFEPVYIHLRGSVKVQEYWPKLQPICKALDDSAFLLILKEVLQQQTLIRRDEVLFAYAVYLATDIDVKWKSAARIAFPICIQNDKDLFLFCKYARLIQKEQKHKGLSKTVRRAMIAWYEHQTPDAIRNMWLDHRGEHGFTHRALIKLCHISDEIIGAPGVVSPFFKTCTELLKDSESGGELAGITLNTPKTNVTQQKSPKEENVTTSPLQSTTETAAAATSPPVEQTNDKATTSRAAGKTSSAIELSPSPVISMSKLRTTKNKNEALKIIRKFKLHYSQVPGHLLRYAPIMEALIPTMSYFQLLKCWRNMARFNHFDNPKILKLCQAMLDNKKIMRKENIHPIVLLLHINDLGIREDLTKLAPKKVEAMRMSYLQNLYLQSFGNNQGTGLRMHITINLQGNYKKKFLKNQKKLSYYDAAVALAFGYYKKENFVDVFHWVEDKMKLEEIAWTKDMDIKAAKSLCDNIENAKNSQRLVAPVLQALTRKQIYDLFLVIVPTAGRGNPKQTSEFLCKFIDKYREMKNSRAKYVIVCLHKFKRSMTYSLERNENIMEICGLDQNTTNLINNFALNHFG